MIMKEKILNFIVPGAVSLVISGVAAFSNFALMTERMDARIATLEKDSARHELAKEKGFSRLTTRAEDHEQRIVRLEANLGAMQSTLNEVRADVKALLHGRNSKSN